MFVMLLPAGCAYDQSRTNFYPTCHCYTMLIILTCEIQFEPFLQIKLQVNWSKAGLTSF